MPRFRASRPLQALLALPLTLAATSARAQGYPQIPGPDAPLPPSAQPLPPEPYAEPYVMPAPYSAPPPPPYRILPAQEGWTDPNRDRTPPSNWYGWQTLVATAPFDIAMFAALATYSSQAGSQAFAVAFTGRNLVPAVVHFAHGRVGRGFGSIGLMAASAATGVAVGYAFGLAFQSACPPLDPCRNGERPIPPAAGYGAIIGSMAGTALDVIFFGYRQRLSWTAARNEPSWTVAPFAMAHTGGLSAGFTL